MVVGYPLVEEAFLLVEGAFQSLEVQVVNQILEELVVDRIQVVLEEAYRLVDPTFQSLEEVEEEAFLAHPSQ